MSKRKTIGEHARDVAIEHHRRWNLPWPPQISWDDGDLLHEIAERAGVKPKIEHPLEFRRLVLDGLGRSPLREKWYYLIVVGRDGREGLLRAFTLKEEAPA